MCIKAYSYKRITFFLFIFASLLLVNPPYASACSWEEIADNIGFADTDLALPATTIHKCGNPFLRQIKQQWNVLNIEAQNFFLEQTHRPSTSVLPETITTKHFKIHYTLTGDNRPLGKRANNVEIEKWLNQLAFYLEDTYTILVEERNYQPPPLDGTVGGGNNLYDVYVKNLALGTYGMTSVDRPVEENSTCAITYMFVSNSIGLSKDPLSKVNVLRATAQHEFFHAIQNGYYGSYLASMPNNKVSTSKSNSLIEGTAVWAETLNHINQTTTSENERYYVYLGIKPNVFSDPYRHLFTYEQSSESLFAYSSVFFWKYLAEQFGDDIIKEIWEGNKAHYEGSASLKIELEVLDKALATYGGLNEILGNYLITNLLLKDQANYAALQVQYPAYTFKHGLNYLHYLNNQQAINPLKKPTHYHNSIWYNTQPSQSKYWDIQAIGGAAFYELSYKQKSTYNLTIKPPKSFFEKANIPVQLYAVLVQEDKTNQQLSIQKSQQKTPNEALHFTIPINQSIPQNTNTPHLIPLTNSSPNKQHKHYLLLFRLPDYETYYNQTLSSLRLQLYFEEQ